jgi:hypothetical protein
MTLYLSAITKDTVIALKGWNDAMREITKADARASADMPQRKQMLTQLAGQPIRDVLAKTAMGSFVLAREAGEDMSKWQAPAPNFDVRDSAGMAAKSDLPKEWQQSLILLYKRGFDNVPVLDKKSTDELNKIVKDNPIAKTVQEALPQKAANSFLTIAMGSKLAEVRYADDKDTKPVADVNKDISQTLRDARSIYGPVTFAAAQDTLLYGELPKEMTSEYGPAPALPGGVAEGGQGRDEEHGDTRGEGGKAGEVGRPSGQEGHGPG